MACYCNRLDVLMGTTLFQIVIIFQMVMLRIADHWCVEGQNTNFNFSHFTKGSDSFMTVNDAHYYADSESFSMNERGTALYSESCGRVLYKEKVRMKDLSSGAVASFHTAFTFRIHGAKLFRDEKGWVHGDGLAFTFLRNSNITDEAAGQFFCLFKDTGNNGVASNRLFAVEFDTFENDNINDPSNQHIGVDINGVESKWYYNLCGGTVRNCTYLWNGGFFTAWIDYDSASEKLEIFFSNGSLNVNSVSKPAKPLLNASVSLSDVLDEFMYVGFSASTGFYATELHQIQSWAFQSTGMPDSVTNSSPTGGGTFNSTQSKGSRGVGIIVGASVGAVAALLVVSLFIATCWKRRISSKKEDKFSLVDRNLVPRAFTYKELCKATKNFSRSELLGSGGFGAVYKGTLHSGGLVAVKRMRHESKHGVESFQTEAASLSQIRHRNLVQLRGWCSEEEQLFLVYDFMCNGSLDEWLFTRRVNLKEEGEVPLSLNLRHSVLSGVAGALAYLHEECAQCVLHRDIKSSNVLLDGELNAYLGDFGLARLIDHRKVEKTTMMAGTLGYMAPEMPHTGKATKESDVYSFGVLMLEVICGARPLDIAAIERGNGILVDRVWRAHEAGKLLQVADFTLVAFPLFDANAGLSDDGLELQEVSSIMIDASGATEEKKLITNLLHLGLLCCNPNPEDRPSMRLVSQLLHSSENMEMSMPALPICKPHARYSRPGFSQLAINIPESSDSSALSNVVDVADAAGEAGSSHSSAPLSGPVSNIDPANTQTSFVASSAIFSGR